MGYCGKRTKKNQLLALYKQKKNAHCYVRHKLSQFSMIVNMFAKKYGKYKYCNLSYKERNCIFKENTKKISCIFRLKQIKTKNQFTKPKNIDLKVRN